MPESQPRRHVSAYLRESLLFLGFLLLVVAAGITVVAPELSEDEDDSVTPGADAGTP